MNSRINNRSKLFKNAGTTTQGLSCTVQTSTTPTTILTLRILKCNNASRFLFLLIFFYCLHTVYLHWNGKVKRKIEIFLAFSTPRIFHTPHFPHSTLHTPHSELHVFHGNVSEGLSSLKSNFREHAKNRISASFSLGNISSQQVTFLSL